MKKAMKKIKEIRREILYKWHWFWYSIHLNWLVGDYLIAAGCSRWAWISDNNTIERIENGENNISKNE